MVTSYITPTYILQVNSILATLLSPFMVLFCMRANKRFAFTKKIDLSYNNTAGHKGYYISSKLPTVNSPCAEFLLSCPACCKLPQYPSDLKLPSKVLGVGFFFFFTLIIPIGKGCWWAGKKSCGSHIKNLLSTLWPQVWLSCGSLWPLCLLVMKDRASTVLRTQFIYVCEWKIPGWKSLNANSLGLFIE